MTKQRFLTLTSFSLAAAVLLSGCSSTETDSANPNVSSETEEFLADYDLDNRDVREVVDTLDAMPVDERPAGLGVSIEAEHVVFVDEQERTASLPLPEDEFYISIAPYLTQTHDCYFHVPTSCIGELRNTDLDITVTDSDTGEVLVDDTIRTFDNGFVGLWLPRNITASITIEHEGASATSEFSTAGSDTKTCETTIKLT